jgi:hypothetical protein
MFNNKIKTLNKTNILKTTIMKLTRIFKTGMTLMIGALLTTSSYAKEDPVPANTADSEENISTLIKVQPNMNTDVSIMDREGIIIFSDRLLKKSEAGKMYDLSNLENGTYTFITESDQKTVEKTLKVENSEIKVLKEEKEYLPVFKIDGDILRISYFNSEGNDISITLEDNAAIYFESERSNELSYGKMLNIKKLSRGDYSVSLEAGPNTYYYSFER